MFHLKKLDMALMHNGKWLQTEFTNSHKSHATMIRYLKKRSKQILVCVEATGIYHLELSLALHDAANIEVMVINPRAGKDFAKAMMQRSKTDTSDARMLAEYAQRMPFVAWSPPKASVWELRAIARRMDVLSRQSIAEKNRLHSSLSDLVGADIEVNIRHLKRRMEQLQKKAMELIEHDDVLLQKFTLITTIIGIAELSAIRILGEILMLPDDMIVRQWVAHAGLDPRAHESGSSIKKQTRISKVGNSHLRHALYMPALSASMYDEGVKRFREQLALRGKTPMQGVVAVMRKRLHSIYGVLKNKTPYDSNLFYQNSGILA
ncbi:MAG: IS110 family transposase [Mariprofundus sp.]|nr:IS110 family transposase [Mariprofundus sp.]